MRSSQRPATNSLHRRHRLSLLRPPPSDDHLDPSSETRYTTTETTTRAGMPAITDPPWPRPTSPPTPSSNHDLLNHFRHQQRRNSKRQDDDPDCSHVGNDVWTCAPKAGQVVVQNTTMHFVWNANQPLLRQQDLVDVYLFHEDAIAIAANKTHLQNLRGAVAFDVNDQWWGTRGDQWDGKNISYPMYFVIVANGHVLDGSEPRGPTFTAIQTRVPDSILAQERAASASSASVSAAAAASASSAQLTSRPSSGGTLSGSSPESSINPSTPNSAGSIQSPTNNNSLPSWAIALLVIFGTLALLSFLLVSYLGVQRFRRNRNDSAKHRPDSVGSSTPIMADVRRGDSQREPLVQAPLPSTSPALESSQAHSPFIHASSKPRSIAGSTTTRDTEGGLFSGADAALMAAAFRDTLRKPDFADRPLEEGESPEGNGEDKDVLERELAEEGTGLRSVNSSRVRVEGDEGEMGTVRGRRRDHDEPDVDSG